MVSLNVLNYCQCFIITAENDWNKYISILMLVNYDRIQETEINHYFILLINIAKLFLIVRFANRFVFISLFSELVQFLHETYCSSRGISFRTSHDNNRNE